MTALAQLEEVVKRAGGSIPTKRVSVYHVPLRSRNRGNPYEAWFAVADYAIEFTKGRRGDPHLCHRCIKRVDRYSALYKDHSVAAAWARSQSKVVLQKIGQITELEALVVMNQLLKGWREE